MDARMLLAGMAAAVALAPAPAWALDCPEAGSCPVVAEEVVSAPDRAKLALPNDATIDAAGNRWVVNLGTHSVHRYAPDGTLTLVIGGPGPGSGNDQLSSPTSVDVENGDVYVADNGNRRIQRFDAATGAYEASYGQGGERYTAVAVHPGTGRVFALSQSPPDLYGFTDTGPTVDIAFDGISFPSEGLDVGGNFVFAADQGVNEVLRYPIAGGSPDLTFGGPDVPGGQLDQIDGLAVVGEGVVLVDSDPAEVQLHRFMGNGTYDSTVAATGGVETGRGGLGAGGSELILAERDANRVSLLSIGGGRTGGLGTQPAADEVITPVDADGSGIILGGLPQRIARLGAFDAPLSVSGRAAGVIPAAPGDLFQPGGLAGDGAGGVLVADVTVKRFGPDGAYLGSIGSVGVGPGQLIQPVDVAFSGGLAYVLDQALGKVAVYNLAGAFVGEFQPGQLSQPRAIAVGGGKAYVADTGNTRVVRFGLNGAFEQAVAVPQPRGVDVQGTEVVVTDAQNAQLRFLRAGDLSTRATVDRPGATLGRVAFEADGNVVLVDGPVVRRLCRGGPCPAPPQAPADPGPPAQAPSTPLPGAPTPVPPALPSGPAEAEILRCSGRQVALLDLRSEGRTARVRGVAVTGLAGRRVVLRVGDRQVGRATVQRDGTFTARVTLPTRDGRQRLTATVDRRSSAAFFVERRVAVLGRQAVGGGVRITGRVRGAKAGSRITLTRQAGCGRPVRGATARLGAGGRFSVVLARPARGLYLYRVVVPVGRSATYTLPIAVTPQG